MSLSAADVRALLISGLEGAALLAACEELERAGERNLDDLVERAAERAVAMMESRKARPQRGKVRRPSPEQREFLYPLPAPAVAVESVPAVSVQRSAGAVRTARWRARQRLAVAKSVTPVTGVTPGDASQGADRPKIAGRRAKQASRGDGVTAKKTSPHTPLRKNHNPQTPLAAGQVASIEIHGDDPLFAELEAMRGGSCPRSKTGGWYFTPDEVERARRRLHAGAGPPLARTG